MNAAGPLPSWRPGATRDAVLDFLDGCRFVPVEERVAYLDNDGTLWCERPAYVQYDFFVTGLRSRAAQDPSVTERPELAAVLSGDQEQVAALGLERIALALAGLYEGMEPETFAAEVRQFAASATHAVLGRPVRGLTYQPMLELLGALRELGFTVGVVTGGGTEFVRALSADLYGVPPELVVGTLLEHELTRDASGRPRLQRTSRLLGRANEGPAKVTNIQTQLGRRPILAAGNSAGDREMLEWAVAGRGPALALLVDHDDAEREFAYVSESVTVAEREPITRVAERLGWTVVSMARDWETVFSTV